ncbi:hypothetical protein AgCh_024294 [Apium graveolens]
MCCTERKKSRQRYRDVRHGVRERITGGDVRSRTEERASGARAWGTRACVPRAARVSHALVKGQTVADVMLTSAQGFGRVTRVCASILDAHKLTGPNYADWLRNMRIVLRIEKLEYVIDSPKPTEPASDAHNNEHVVYRRWIDDVNVAQCIMLASMNIELQKQHEHMDAHTILMHLQELYDVAGRTARYEISKELFGCRMSEGSSVNDHVLKMINLIERLGQLGFAMDGELSQDLVLQSLPSSFSQFVVNFHMNKLDVSLPELHNMLKTAESNFPPKKSSVLLIGECFNPKKRKRIPSKKKKVGEKTPVPPKAEDPKSKVVCFHCNKVGNWKRNCKVYLAELKKKKGSETTASDSGIFMIEVNMSLSQISTWVLDTAYGSDICNSLQGPRRSRTLEEEESPFSRHGKRTANLLGMIIDLDSDMCLMKHKSEAFEKFKDLPVDSSRLVSERRNRTLLDMVRSMMSYANLPVFLWGYALETSAYLLNKVPSKSVPQTPHATFLEKEFILEGNSGSKIELVEVQEAQTTTDQVETPILTEQPSVEQPIHRSGRVSLQPESIDSEKWHSAMKSGMKSMYTGYKRMIRTDGQVETYKARLVAKEFKQRQWIDFD